MAPSTSKYKKAVPLSCLSQHPLLQPQNDLTGVYCDLPKALSGCAKMFGRKRKHESEDTQGQESVRSGEPRPTNDPPAQSGSQNLAKVCNYMGSLFPYEKANV
jgi:hypothetical protein